MIELLQKIFDSFINNINNGNYGVAIIILVVLLTCVTLWKAKVITDYWRDMKNIRSQNLQVAISRINHKDIKEFLENKLTEEEFFRVTKIKAELKYIEKLIQFHRHLNGKYSFTYIIRASKYMSIEDNKLKITLQNKNWFSWFFDIFLNRIVAIIFMIFGFLLILSIPFLKSKSPLTGLEFSIFGVIFLLSGLFFITQTFPYTNAKNLKSDLEAYNLLNNNQNLSNQQVQDSSVGSDSGTGNIN